MLQRPVLDTVWGRSLDVPKTNDSFLKLVRIDKIGFTGGGQELRPRGHVIRLSNCRTEGTVPG